MTHLVDSRTAVYQVVKVTLSLILTIAFFYASLATVKSGTQIYLEYAKRWQILEARIEGEDLIVSGLVYKTLDCDYYPPPQARLYGVSPEKTFVVRSFSPEANLPWRVSEFARNFGPWRVYGGAKMDGLIEFFQVYDCFDILPIGSFAVRVGSYNVKVPK